MYNLCFVINRNYIGQFMVTFNSIVYNNKNKKFNVNIIESDLNSLDKERINKFVNRFDSIVNFYDVDNSLFKNSAHMASDSSYTTYYKLFIFKLLSGLDKVLYLDCDMVIDGDIDELYNYNSNELLTVVKDREVMNSDKKYIYSLIEKKTNYFNAGMILFNLSKENLAKVNMDEINDFIINKSAYLHMHDQDIFNHFFNCKASYINSKFNYFTIYSSIFQFILPIHFKKGIVIHYVGLKPWKNNYIGLYYKKYRKYYNMTKKIENISFYEKRNVLSSIKMYFTMLDSRIKRNIKKILGW